MKRSPIKTRALTLMREATAVGYDTEQLCTDYAVHALCKQGVEEAVARRHVRRVWNESFAIMRPI